MITPGRPSASRFIIEYKRVNSTTGWSEIRSLKRSRRAITSEGTTSISSAESTTVQILAQDIYGVKGPLEFQVFSVTKDNVRSLPRRPCEVFQKGNKLSLITRACLHSDSSCNQVPFVLKRNLGICNEPSTVK